MWAIWKSEVPETQLILDRCRYLVLIICILYWIWSTIYTIVHGIILAQAILQYFDPYHCYHNPKQKKSIRTYVLMVIWCQIYCSAIHMPYALQDLANIFWEAIKTLSGYIEEKHRQLQEIQNFVMEITWITAEEFPEFEMFLRFLEWVPYLRPLLMFGSTIGEKSEKLRYLQFACQWFRMFDYLVTPKYFWFIEFPYGLLNDFILSYFILARRTRLFMQLGMDSFWFLAKLHNLNWRRIILREQRAEHWQMIKEDHKNLEDWQIELTYDYHYELVMVDECIDVVFEFLGRLARDEFGWCPFEQKLQDFGFRVTKSESSSE